MTDFVIVEFISRYKLDHRWMPAQWSKSEAFECDTERHALLTSAKYYKTQVWSFLSTTFNHFTTTLLHFAIVQYLGYNRSTWHSCNNKTTIAVWILISSVKYILKFHVSIITVTRSIRRHFLLQWEVCSYYSASWINYWEWRNIGN